MRIPLTVPKLPLAAPTKKFVHGDIRTGENQLTLEGYTGKVNSLAFSPEGDTLAVGGKDNVIRFWDSHTGVLRQTLEGHSREVYSLAYSPDGMTLASSAKNGIRQFVFGMSEQAEAFFPIRGINKMFFVFRIHPMD